MAPLDNAAVARVLREIGDLLELKGENPFKIRAYRNAADIVANTPEQASTLDQKGLLAWPGIGKDLAARIVEICQTGSCTVHRELAAHFPSTLLDLLRLQGVGPKTVALLYGSLGIASLDHLEAAARSGRLREVKGMGARKEQLLLRALAERKQHANRHLLPDAAEVAGALVAHLQAESPTISYEIVGSLRRGTDTCGDIDILALAEHGKASAAPSAAPAASQSLMAMFTGYDQVERVLGQGETKSSVLIRGGYQADLRLVAPESRGAALQYFTGSKSHNIALRDRALDRGWRLSEYGLFRVEDETRLAGETEESIYHALDLEWVPPELREHRGEIEAAAARGLPMLLTASDIRGDLHMHTTETDGKDDLESMVLAARTAGHEYIAITDHSKVLAMANGLDEHRALAHAARIRALNDRVEGIRVLAGIECDILPDGTMDLASDCLAELDIVVASIHLALRQEEAELTDRVLRAIEHPWVDIIAHPTSRRLLSREPSKMNLDQVSKAAAARGVALEINCHADRLDLSDVNARMARERGATLVISSDAHSVRALAMQRWGVVVARRAWATRADVLNALPFEEFSRSLRRNRARG
jgi:DNA polymerase (family 10)